MFNPIEVWLPGIICIVIMFIVAFWPTREGNSDSVASGKEETK